MSKRALDHGYENGESSGNKQPRLDHIHQHPSLPPKPSLSGHESAETPTNSNAIFLSYPPLNQPLKSPPFQQPTPLISFSYNEDHVQEFTDSALRYYRPIPTESLNAGGANNQRGRGRGGWNGNRQDTSQIQDGVDLNYGYERWVRKPEDRGRLDPLLKAVDRVCQREGSAQSQEGKMKLRDISIVAWRGVITKTLTAPYEERDGWSLNCMVVDGTLYLEEHLTEEKIADKNDVPDKQRRNMYYGYAFESFCTTDTWVQSTFGHSSSISDPSPSRNGSLDTPAKRDGTFTQEPEHPLWGGDVNTNVQWCSVVKTKLGDMRIIIGGEVDCVKGDYQPHRTDNFVELKTSMTMRKWNQGDESRFDK
ncbi:decapping endonuclease targeting mRNA [Marasmius sp. AFHP31]|nr:decapping endonuclease targeting mRNA [Marasmius sp. AFHP31]